MTGSSFSRHSIVARPEGGTVVSVAIRDHEVRTDQPARLGGTDTAPSPLELMGASLSGCVALYVQKFCDGAGVDATDLVVEVRPVWREEPGRIGRFDVVLHLPESIAAEHHAAIERVARTCPVHHTLAFAPEVTFELRVPEVAAV